ncbi:MAG: hypothetical protein P8R36_04675 [Actinomycetota bacterium]|nr:hypothetical protein [Actinomycetota bacterium]MDG1489561.1 hypothetical protein [Actinomycetota bacterium]MDG2120304.1 hypothetical protein [Actinomycetota bacterium]
MLMWNRFMNARVGSSGAATQALVELVQSANESTGRSASIYQSLIGPPMGRIWIADMYRSVGEMVAVQDQLWANEGFVAQSIEFAKLLDSPPEDITARIVQVNGEMSAPPEVMSVVTWHGEPRTWQKTMEWACKMSAAGAEATGWTNVVMAMTQPRPFTVGILSNMGSFDELDAGTADGPPAAMVELMAEYPEGARPVEMESMIARKIA